MIKNKILIASLLMVWVCVESLAAELPLTTFPLDNYSQSIDDWVSPSMKGYGESLLSSKAQKANFKEYYNTVFESNSEGLSPWSPNGVEQALVDDNGNTVLEKWQMLSELLAIESSTGFAYATNFRPYTDGWIERLQKNMKLERMSLNYDPARRAIAVKNLAARLLPTNDPFFYHYTIPGEGYPFDNLQNSSLWAGTPVYILHETKDKSWMLILSNSFMGWVESDGIARVDEKFITTWQIYAKNQLAAIVKTKTPITTNNGLFAFSAYIGTVLPIKNSSENHFTLLIPLRDHKGYAVIDEAKVKKTQAVKMPWVPSPQNFAKVIKQLVNRPYGWGGLNFNNDCSQELQSLFTPFAIWLPRNSKDQAAIGHVIDKTDLTMHQRIQYLKDNGKPFLSYVYIGGHVFLYLGNDGDTPITYQNVWGLAPQDRSTRFVVGQAVILPLLTQFSENTALNSQANASYFTVVDVGLGGN